MNKADLVIELAVKMSITQQQSREFVNVFQEILTDTIKQDMSIILQGFGSFIPWMQKERSGRNPHTGISCAIPARMSVKFKPGKHLLEELNS